MAKVFTITTGLENMGAMKTGGQGSVYKGRRIGEIITAIKLLPTPIYSESEDDKNYRDFRNEVEKLKKVNQIPNPNVVKILSSGLSETGNFPFIEMEYIEGPDLEELLKPPYDPVFSIKEVLKVAEHLSNALAHCHKLEVRHGDIKSNNVKYNFHTGNYILLDFGLAIMSDEQRRSSLRHAGAVEFMAPEQNEGQMLFQTDVYSFGVIMFELLAGRVPFPLQDKGETARNIVRLSHIETPAPDIFPLRKENMPATWTSEKKDREMHLPDWLVKMTYKCLNKEPEKRFKNGIDLYDFIHHNIAHTSEITEASFVPEKLVKEREQLQNQLAQYQQLLSVKERELSDLKGRLSSADLASKGVIVERDEYYVPQQKNGVSKTVFISLLLVTIALAAFSAYSLIKRGQNNSAKISTTAAPEKDTTVSVIDVPTQTLAADTAEQPENAEKPLTTLDTTNKAKAPPIPEPKRQEDTDTADEEVENDAQTIEEQPQEVPVKQTSNYVVVSRAYFHSEPDENTRRAAYIIPSNSTVVTALDEKNGFIYVIFDNRVTKTSGWLRKTDLQTVNR